MIRQTGAGSIIKYPGCFNTSNLRLAHEISKPVLSSCKGPAAGNQFWFVRDYSRLWKEYWPAESMKRRRAANARIPGPRKQQHTSYALTSCRTSLDIDAANRPWSSSRLDTVIYKVDPPTLMKK